MVQTSDHDLAGERRACLPAQPKARSLESSIWGSPLQACMGRSTEVRKCAKSRDARHVGKPARSGDDPFARSRLQNPGPLWRGALRLAPPKILSAFGSEHFTTFRIFTYGASQHGHRHFGSRLVRHVERVTRGRSAGATQ